MVCFDYGNLFSEWLLAGKVILRLKLNSLHTFKYVEVKPTLESLLCTDPRSIECVLHIEGENGCAPASSIHLKMTTYLLQVFHNNCHVIKYC